MYFFWKLVLFTMLCIFFDCMKGPSLTLFLDHSIECPKSIGIIKGIFCVSINIDVGTTDDIRNKFCEIMFLLIVKCGM